MSTEDKVETTEMIIAQLRGHFEKSTIPPDCIGAALICAGCQIMSDKGISSESILERLKGYMRLVKLSMLEEGTFNDR